MDRWILEGCVDSLESALAAQRGGADRLELCSNLVIGGTTPDAALFKQVRQLGQIKINVLIRPRFGDFCYTDSEFERILDAVRLFADLGADGVVIGVLQPDGSLDAGRMARIMAQVPGLPVTLHRAFDQTADPSRSLAEAIELGVTTILTSGQQATCLEGVDLLKTLVTQAAGRIDILAGAGVSAQNIAAIWQQTGIQSYHLSGKIILDSPMRFRNPAVQMGLPSLDEFSIYQTDEKQIRAARTVIDRLARQ